MKIAFAQLNPKVGDLDGNVNRMVGAAEEAASQGADMIVYGAHALTGATLDGMLGSAAFVNDAREHMERFANRCPIIAIANCPVPVEDEDGDITILPELLIAGPEGIDSFGVPLLSEDDECPVIEVNGESVALLLENNFAEGMANTEIDVLIEIASQGLGEPFAASAAWGTVGRLSNVARGCRAWAVNVNLCGGSDSLVFAGNSMLIAPDGELAYACSIQDEEVVVFDTKDGLDGVQFDKDGAVMAPDEIAWHGLVSATRDYVRKNGFTDVVVGVSGGLDSAVVCTIAVDALGPEYVHGVLMPGPYTSEQSNEDAETLCENLGVETTVIAIDGPQGAFHEALAPSCGGAVEGLAAENLQARIRMIYLMTLSNAHGWMVLNTGNKSEAAMGFSTLYGDTCGAFAPIGDIYKTDVYDLARWRMGQGASIPQSCLDKAPSAELYEGGVDADRLPPYDKLDDLLFDHVEGEMDASDLKAEGHDPALVADVLRRVMANEYKRRLEPLSPNVRGTSFAKRDWPVTNGWVDPS